MAPSPIAVAEAKIECVKSDAQRANVSAKIQIDTSPRSDRYGNGVTYARVRIKKVLRPIEDLTQSVYAKSEYKRQYGNAFAHFDFGALALVVDFGFYVNIQGCSRLEGSILNIHFRDLWNGGIRTGIKPASRGAPAGVRISSTVNT
jgi:hypothetical protein